MSHSLTPEDRLRQMTETPIPKLLFTLSTPTIISMLISALYNMADTYFVGLIGNPSATGAVGVCLPLMAIIQAVGFTFGQGSGNFISRALGARDRDGAERMPACLRTSHRCSSCAVSSPQTSTRPSVGRYSAFISFASVLLPEPLCPSTATNEPRGMDKDT